MLTALTALKSWATSLRFQYELFTICINSIFLKYISYGIEPEMQALIKLSHLPIGIAIFPSLAVDGC